MILTSQGHEKKDYEGIILYSMFTLPSPCSTLPHYYSHIARPLGDDAKPGDVLLTKEEMAARPRKNEV
jgi:hypothetical protein